MSTEVRSARPTDVDRICEIIAEALEPEDALEARIVVKDPEFDLDRWLVAVVDGKIESTLALFDSELRVGEAPMRAGQIEFVATSGDTRDQGLVRKQIDEAHRRGDAAGQVAQLIVGIPHFYRRFGYSYAVPVAPNQVIAPHEPLERVAGWEPRLAGEEDIPAIMAAQRSVQSEAALAFTHSPDMWRWLIASPNYDVLITEHKGQVGVARIYQDADSALMCDVVAPTRGALHALIQRARTIEPSVSVVRRPAGLLGAMLDTIGETEDEFGWYYVRIGDPAAFLDALRPELAARLARSRLAGYTGRLTLSMYRSSLSCEFVDGDPGGVEVGGPIPYPVSAGASGVPADRFPDLVLGPHGAAELERLHGDVLLGEQRELMEALFPPLSADVQSWVLA